MHLDSYLLKSICIFNYTSNSGEKGYMDALKPNIDTDKQLLAQCCNIHKRQLLDPVAITIQELS